MDNWQTFESYTSLVKPEWAPPASVFGPVWSVLYLIIAVSFVYVFYLYFKRRISFLTVLPFLLNLIFNLSFTTIQFGLKNLPLASVDIILTLISLVWALTIIWPKAKWVAVVNFPYLLWLLFASSLQLTITYLNR